MKKAIIITVILGVIIALGLYFFKKTEVKQTVTVDTIDVTETFTVSGKVVSDEKAEIMAPLAGTIEKILADEGDKINKGDLILIYDLDELNAKRQELYATINQSQYDYEKLSKGNRPSEIKKYKALYETSKENAKEQKLSYEKLKKDESRYKSLQQKGLITQKEAEDFFKDLAIAKTALDAAQKTAEASYNDYQLAQEGFRTEDIQAAAARVNQAQAQLAQLNERVEKAKVRSPVTGSVIEKVIHEGENILPGDPLFTIIGGKDIKIQANIEEEDIPNIELGDPVQLDFDAYPQVEMKGKVTTIIEKVDPNTRLLPVKIALTDAQNKSILPGMTMEVTFPGHTVTYLVINKTAIQREGKKSYLETPYGKVYVQVGKGHNDKVIIEGNIKKGDKVILP